MSCSNGSNLLGVHEVDGETYWMCPYNPAHVVKQHRHMQHVLKCRYAHAEKMLQQGKVVYMRECRYYAAHIFPDIELPQHEERCADRVRSDANGYAFRRAVEAPKKKPGEFVSAKNPDTDDEEEEKKKAGPTKNELLMARAKAALQKEEEKKIAKEKANSEGGASGGKTEESEEEEEDWELEALMDRLRVNPDYQIPVNEVHYGYPPRGSKLTPRLRSAFVYPTRKY